MSDEKKNVRTILDWKTGVPLQLTLNADNTQLLGMLVKNNGAPVQKNPNANPAAEADGEGSTFKPPYGQTTFGIDATGTDSYDVFTIAWPTKAQTENGAKPAVAVNRLPADLIKNGFASKPRSLMNSDELEAKNLEEIEGAMNNINSLVGLETVKDKLRKQIATTQFAKLREEVLGADVKKPSLHMVFTGDPGTGKTTVAREYAKVLHAMGLIEKPEVMEVGRKDLVGAVIGETEKKTDAVIEEAKGGVLFIDEAYSLVVNGSHNDFGKVAINQIVAEMENNRESLVVIVAGYPEPMKQFINSNEGLKSRFLNYIEFKNYDKEEIGQIMDLMADDMHVELTTEAREEALNLIENERNKSQASFGNGRTVRNMLDLAFENAALRVMEGRDQKALKKMDKEDLVELVKNINVDDIKSVQLDGISSKHGGTIGFREENIADYDDDSDKQPEQNKNNASAQDNTALKTSFGDSAPRRTPSNDDAPNGKSIFSQKPADELRANLSKGRYSFKS
jgi:AAA+ superfamily predicted ATPase